MLYPQPEIATVMAISGMAVGLVGAGCGLVGGGIAFYNNRKAVQWKRAELANFYLRDFNNNPELVFACRCLDWNTGRLALPESFRAINDGAKFIHHDCAVLREALRPDLSADEFDKDPRIQIYRMAIDSFLSWLALVAGALNRNLFVAQDIEEVGYWVAKLRMAPGSSRRRLPVLTDVGSAAVGAMDGPGRTPLAFRVSDFLRR